MLHPLLLFVSVNPLYFKLRVNMALGSLYTTLKIVLKCKILINTIESEMHILTVGQSTRVQSVICREKIMILRTLFVIKTCFCSLLSRQDKLEQLTARLVCRQLLCVWERERDLILWSSNSLWSIPILSCIHSNKPHMKTNHKVLANLISPTTHILYIT